MSAQIIKLPPSLPPRWREWSNDGDASDPRIQLRAIDRALAVLRYNRARLIKAINAEIWQKCREDSCGTDAMHRRHQRYVAKFDHEIEEARLNLGGCDANADN